MTLWFMMMLHNTKFGNKMFDGLEDTIWTNINILPLPCDLDPESRNPFFFHRTLCLMMIYIQTMFSCQGINSSENIVESYFDHMSLTVTLTVKIAKNKNKNIFFSTRHSGPWCCITILNLVTNCSVTQTVSSRQAFINIWNLCCNLNPKCSHPIFSTGCSGLWCCLVWLQTNQ